MRATRRLEGLLARMLRHGSWASSAVIAIGLVLTAFGWPHAAPVVMAGILLLILLPVSRVVAMLVVFVLERDYPFGAAAAIVLIVMGLSFALGALG